MFDLFGIRTVQIRPVAARKGFGSVPEAMTAKQGKFAPRRFPTGVWGFGQQVGTFV
jgi:hypothetical protein